MEQAFTSSSAGAFVIDRLRHRENARLIAIAGIPGAGKSTLSADLLERIPDAAIIPMDGYHLERRLLDAEGVRRRGAPHTFDSEAFRRDIAQLRETGEGQFPGWDHALKDPSPNQIKVTRHAPVVLVEGLYLLMQSWRMGDLFDFRIFVDCDLETAMRRVAARHIACGLCATPEEAQRRIDTNDRLNAQAIIADGCRERADLVVQTG